MEFGELMFQLDMMSGKTLEDPLLLDLLQAGIKTFNAYAPQQIGLIGRDFDRVPSAKEQQCIVYFALNLYLFGEQVNAARAAVIHSNAAGKTDLSKSPGEIRAAREAILTTVGEIMGSIEGGAISAAAAELGETLFPYTGAYAGACVYGQPWYVWCPGWH